MEAVSGVRWDLLAEPVFSALSQPGMLRDIRVGRPCSMGLSPALAGTSEGEGPIQTAW